MSCVGDEIKQRRESMGLSQNQLAKRAGCAQSTLSMIESSTKKPSTETLRGIASALGCTVAELMGESQGDDQPRLTQEEQEILAAYRKASPDRRQIVRDVLRVRGFEEEAAAI